MLAPADRGATGPAPDRAFASGNPLVITLARPLGPGVAAGVLFGQLTRRVPSSDSGVCAYIDRHPSVVDHHLG